MAESSGRRVIPPESGRVLWREVAGELGYIMEDLKLEEAARSGGELGHVLDQIRIEGAARGVDDMTGAWSVFVVGRDGDGGRFSIPMPSPEEADALADALASTVTAAGTAGEESVYVVGRDRVEQRFSIALLAEEAAALAAMLRSNAAAVRAAHPN